MNSNYDDDPKVLLTNAKKFGENSHFVTNTQTHMNESASQQTRTCKPSAEFAVVIADACIKKMCWTDKA